MNKDLVEEIILKELDNIISKNNAQLLFAVESGSRLWNIQSGNSDYDVRFIYFYDAEQYLEIFGSRPDQIDHMKELNLNGKSIQVDFVGWDLKKLLQLLGKSNPTAIEWIHSSICYRDHEIREELQSVCSVFNRFSLFKHYQSLAKSNFLKYISDTKEPELKKYLYVLRGLLSASYIYFTQKRPPLNFVTMVNALSTGGQIVKDHESGKLENIIPIQPEIVDQIKTIIELKREGEEEKTHTVPRALNNFVRNLLATLMGIDEEDMEQDQYINKDQLNSIFKKTVL